MASCFETSFPFVFLIDTVRLLIASFPFELTAVTPSSKSISDIQFVINSFLEIFISGS